MNTEEGNKIIAGNRLIAEFMGAKHITDMWPEDWFFYDCSAMMDKIPIYEPGVTVMSAKEFRYHSSWDWQIPVWEKIAHIIQKLAVDSQVIQNWHLRWADNYESAVFTNNPQKGFETIVSAIKYYNSLQQPKQTGNE